MRQQKSYVEETIFGKLYLVPTPIGNLEDMTFRAIKILNDVDWIAAEDTRNTKKLCNYFDIHTPLLSYHEHNKEKSGKHIIQLLVDGENVAIVSDAGMPAISDPGYEIVRDAIAHGITVISIPGANAALTALTASGIVPHPFYFYGFLKRKRKEKKEELQQLVHVKDTIIFYEAPHRMDETIKAIYEVLGDRNIVLARELTKKYEEYIRGKTSDILQWIEDHEVRGEFCIVVEGSNLDEVPQQPDWSTLSIPEHVQKYIKEGFSSKEAIKKVALERKIPKRDVYQQFHIDEE